MNVVGIVGRLTRDPDLRRTSDGTSVANCTVAVDDRGKTVFVDVTIWDKRAEAFAKYHKRGDMCAIEGHLTMDKWEDRETKKKRTKLKVTCDSWSFTRNKSEDR